MTNKKLLIFILLVFFHITLAKANFIDFKIKESRYNKNLSYVDIYLNSIYIFRYIDKSKLVKENLKKLKYKILNALYKNYKNPKIFIKYFYNQNYIYLNNYHIFTINNKIANINALPKNFLSKQIKLNMYIAFKKDYISFLKEEITLPIDKKTQIPIILNTNKKINLISNKNLLDCKLKKDKIIIKPKQVCDTKIILTTIDKSKKDILKIKIREYAGKILINKTLLITLSYKNDKLLKNREIKKLIIENIKEKIKLKVDANYKIKFLKKEKGYIDLEIKLYGPLYIPVKKRIKVIIKNLKLNINNKYDYILLSNNPENIKHTGVIFENTIISQKNNVILLDHVNKTKDLIYIIGYIKNNTKKTLKIAIYSKTFKPSKNTLKNGILLSKKLLTNCSEKNLYKIIELKPNKSYKFILKKLKPKQNLTSFNFFKIINNSYKNKLLIWIEARKYNDLFKNIIYLHKKSNYNRLSAKIKNPYISINKAITIDNKTIYKEIQIGKENKLNYGDYGYIYNINLSFFNKTDKEKKLYINFKPIAGISKFIYILNNKLYKTPTIYPKEIFNIIIIKIPPQKNYNLKINTTPVFNYFYPSSLIITNKKL